MSIAGPLQEYTNPIRYFHETEIIGKANYEARDSGLPKSQPRAVILLACFEIGRKAVQLQRVLKVGYARLTNPVWRFDVDQPREDIWY